MDEKKRDILETFLLDVQFDLSFERIKNYIEAHNGAVFFQTEENQPLIGRLLSELGISNFPKNKHAFSIMDATGRTLIFLESNLPESVRLHCLKHELGHMLLGHNKDIGMIHAQEAEQEADAFAILAEERVREQSRQIDRMIAEHNKQCILKKSAADTNTILQRQKKITHTVLVLAAAFCILTICVGVVTSFHRKPVWQMDQLPRSVTGQSFPVPTAQDGSIPDDMVVIMAGPNFHNPECRVIQEAKEGVVVYLPKSEAALLHKPCPLCQTDMFEQGR